MRTTRARIKGKPVEQEDWEQMASEEQRLRDEEQQRFIDACVIALFARGWPKDTLFQRAEELWKMREEYKKGKS